jgi:hypothetical protein
LLLHASLLAASQRAFDLIGNCKELLRRIVSAVTSRFGVGISITGSTLVPHPVRQVSKRVVGIANKITFWLRRSALFILPVSYTTIIVAS